MFGSLKAIVYFQINRDGTIDNDIRISQSSGNDGFDQNAIKAVELAAPFKPLPKDFKDNTLSVYFEFKYHSGK
jgi:periplasmic protein TonB